MAIHRNVKTSQIWQTKAKGQLNFDCRKIKKKQHKKNKNPKIAGKFASLNLNANSAKTNSKKRKKANWVSSFKTLFGRFCRLELCLLKCFSLFFKKHMQNVLEKMFWKKNRAEHAFKQSTCCRQQKRNRAQKSKNKQGSFFS